MWEARGPIRRRRPTALDRAPASGAAAANVLGDRPRQRPGARHAPANALGDRPRQRPRRPPPPTPSATAPANALGDRPRQRPRRAPPLLTPGQKGPYLTL